MKTPILSTGMSGLVGTRIRELLEDKYDFQDLSLATNIDITDYDVVAREMDASKAKIVLHMAAMTDVDACEDDKILGEEGASWQINVIGTKNISECAKKTGKKVIYISTDFVFDGTADFYQESDEPNPVNWYGYTKYEGEKIVLGESDNCVVVRIAYPYRGGFEEKKDFVRKILERMKASGTLVGLKDHIYTPTFIDDIGAALNLLMDKDINGIYHAVGSQSLSTYEGIRLIASTFGYDVKVTQTTREVFFKGRAYRPFNLSLKNDKIQKLGVLMNRFDSGLKIVKEQLASNVR